MRVSFLCNGKEWKNDSENCNEFSYLYTQKRQNMANYYRANDRMADIIEDNYNLLQVLSRFGMSLGFGDKSVEEVCKMYKVDATTFLAIINFVHCGYTQVTEEIANLSVPALLDYLRQSHVYFLDYIFPHIHANLHSALNEDSENPINRLINKQFDSCISTVTKHMRYEDRTLFPYVEKLLNGEIDETFELQTFSRNHHSIDDELRELKQILIKYSPEDTQCCTVSDLRLRKRFGCTL